MTAADPAATAAAQTGPAREDAPRSKVDAWLDRWSERLNPILVKEARQALKSRQFAFTFFLVLICAWGWSFLGVALAAPSIYFAVGGPLMLAGYFWILLFPLLVVVPFTAFYSLSAERDDGTFELVSITTLGARQIIAGRLATSVLQLLVYLSALMPCIAFTYLLRGVDLILILMLVFYASALSLLLTSAALMAAALSYNRAVRVILAMLLLIGLVVLFFTLGANVAETLIRGVRFDYAAREFWLGQAAVVSIGASFFLLFSVAAAAAITFVSHNRSTPLRLVMLLQQAIVVGWAMWSLQAYGLDGVRALVYVWPFYWCLMGAMMIGESPHLHHRARRRLPQSFLARMSLTWLFPGPGTGYVFTVANVCSLMVVVYAGWVSFIISRSAAGSFGWSFFSDNIGWYLAAVACYVTIYLGIARLLMLVLWRFAPLGQSGPAMGLLVTVVVAMTGIPGSIVLQSLLTIQSPATYTLFQLPVPFTTLDEIEQGRIMNYGMLAPGVPLLPVVLIAAALVTLGVNLIFAGGEVRRLREAVPARVLADDAARRPAPPPPKDPLA